MLQAQLVWGIPDDKDKMLKLEEQLGCEGRDACTSRHLQSNIIS